MKTSNLFQALGNDKRIAIIKALDEKPLFVNQIQAATNMRQAECSQVLIQLKAAGILISDKRGTSVLYCLADRKPLELIKLAESFSNGKEL